MKNVNKIKNKKGFINYFILAVLIIYSLSMILMLFWGAMTAIKTEIDFDYTHNTVGFPSGPISEWGWINLWNVLRYSEVNAGPIKTVNILGQLINTIVYAMGCSVIKVFVISVMAYLVSKFNYKLSKIIYTFVVVSMVVPIIGSTPSLLKLLKDLNIYDTFISSFLMNFSFTGMYFLIFCGVFSGISIEYSEAAYIDGASELRVLFMIMFPLVMPTCATLFLIFFIDLWNDYMTCLMFLPSHPTLAYGVYLLQTSKDAVKLPGGKVISFSNAPMKLASCIILAAPITVIFVVFRNKIMGNVTMGGVKE